MKIIQLSFLILCLAVSLYSQKVTKNIALLPLDAKGIDQNLADIISDAMISELNKQGSFDAMERSKMNEILAEQGFQESGACDTENCQVQMGQLLGIDQMITGSIGKFDGSYIINLRRINLGTGKIEGSSTQSTEGGIPEVLGELIPSMISEVCTTQNKDAMTQVPKSPEAIALVSKSPQEASAEPTPTQSDSGSIGRDGFFTEIGLGFGPQSMKFTPTPDQDEKTEVGTSSGISLGYAFSQRMPFFITLKTKTLKYQGENIQSILTQRFFGLGTRYYFNESSFFIGTQIGVGDLTQENSVDFDITRFSSLTALNQTKVSMFYDQFREGAQSSDFSWELDFGYEFSLSKSFKLATQVALARQGAKQKFINPLWVENIQRSDDGGTLFLQTLEEMESRESELAFTTLTLELVLSWD